MTNEDHVDLFTKPVRTTETAPRLADGRPPRGLTAEGWVRTTGWLQFGDRPVSSAHVATVTSLLWALVVAVALLASAPVTAGLVVLLLPVMCGGSVVVLHHAPEARVDRTKHRDQTRERTVAR